MFSSHRAVLLNARFLRSTIESWYEVIKIDETLPNVTSLRFYHFLIKCVELPLSRVAGNRRCRLI